MQNLIVIKTNKQLLELANYLKDKEYVSFDTETTGLSKDAEIIGYSLCAEADVGYYVIIASWNVETKCLNYLETKDTTPTLLSSLLDKKLIMHNGLFDCGMVERQFKIDLKPAFFADTMIMAHLIDENRKVGLKELGSKFYGSSAIKEKEEMKASITKNGGEDTKTNYELYKADADLIAKYGAKDAILTFNLFYEFIPQLFEEKMEKFYFDDESMPLLKGPTYQLNETGLRIDVEKLAALKKSLEVEILELEGFIYEEIQEFIKDKYDGKTKKTVFNMNSGAQIAWLLFDRLDNTFVKLSDAGKELCLSIGMKTPYNVSAKRAYIDWLKNIKGTVWREKGAVFDKKTKKVKGEGKVKDYWHYLSTDKVVLKTFAKKYKWVDALIKHNKLKKLLNTYVGGIQERMRYGIINPSFMQHGTTSGRYACRNPNFQNLPRDDKRIKECIIARPGCVFVGADYSQLEPRVFAYYSQDKRLMECFKSGQDFYSVIGTELFNRKNCSLYKKDKNFFGKLHEDLRNKTKVVALSATYGTTAHNMAPALDSTIEYAQQVIEGYFQKFPQVENMMTEAHELVKKQGYVENLFGRKRRIPEAKKIEKLYGNSFHNVLPYEARNLLNLAVNHRIQSTGASIVNRAAIMFYNECKKANIDAKLVLQVHDSLIVECSRELSTMVAKLLQHCMEKAVELPGVDLVAEPKIGNNLAEV